jgi:putative NADH-flavin reductase
VSKVKLTVFGATGYAGGKILEEAVRRGHEVVAVARSIDAQSVDSDGVTARQGSLHDGDFVEAVVADADVAIVAIPARPLDGKILLDALPALVEAAQRHDTRIGVIGGAGSLYIAEGGPRLIDTPAFPEAARTEAGNHAEVLAAFRRLPEGVKWFYVSPAAEFGSWAPGERTGRYRVNGDVLLTDEDGNSRIGGADFAIAVLDEIEEPAHHQERFTVAY